MELEKSQSPYGALIVMTAFIFAIMMGIFAVKPLLDSNKKYTLEKKQVQAELERYEKKKEILSRIKNNNEELAKFEQAKDTILKVLPQNNDQANTYAQTNGVLADAKVVTNNVRESASTGDTNADGTSVLDPSIHEIALEIVAKGDYPSLMKVFEKFENDLRIFNIKRISLQPTASNQVTYNLSTVAYYKDEVKLED